MRDPEAFYKTRRHLWVILAVLWFGRVFVVVGLWQHNYLGVALAAGLWCAAAHYIPDVRKLMEDLRA